MKCGLKKLQYIRISFGRWQDFEKNQKPFVTNKDADNYNNYHFSLPSWATRWTSGKKTSNRLVTAKSKSSKPFRVWKRIKANYSKIHPTKRGSLACMNKAINCSKKKSKNTEPAWRWSRRRILNQYHNTGHWRTRLGISDKR